MKSTRLNRFWQQHVANRCATLHDFFISVRATQGLLTAICMAEQGLGLHFAICPVRRRVALRLVELPVAWRYPFYFGVMQAKGKLY